MAWVVELPGVCWPRLALVAAVVLPNEWLTLIGHISSSYGWLIPLVAWVAFVGTLVITVALSTATVGFSLIGACGTTRWHVLRRELTWRGHTGSHRCPPMKNNEAAERPVRVLLVDDHTLLRKGLRGLPDREAHRRGGRQG